MTPLEAWGREWMSRRNCCVGSWQHCDRRELAKTVCFFVFVFVFFSLRRLCWLSIYIWQELVNINALFLIRYRFYSGSSFTATTESKLSGSRKRWWKESPVSALGHRDNAGNFSVEFMLCGFSVTWRCLFIYFLVATWCTLLSGGVGTIGIQNWD